MQVFLSWSGDRSRQVADAIGAWLAKTIQSIDPWISTDIDKGTRWSPEVATKLSQSRIGIVCLTKENLNAKWILFEAGALSKTTDAHVCTFLLDISPGDVEQPLGQFQHTSRSEEDLRQLLRTVNSAVAKNGERSLHDSLLNEVFDDNWPKLKSRLDAIAQQPSSEHRKTRTEKQMLEEILTILRAQQRRDDSDVYMNSLLPVNLKLGSGKSSTLRDFSHRLLSADTSSELYRQLLLAELLRSRKDDKTLPSKEDDKKDDSPPPEGEP